MKALTIPGLTTDDDVRWLGEHAAQRAVIIELGPWQGRSTRALADATPGVVYAIDNWSLTRDDISSKAARAACREHLADLLGWKVHLITANSQRGVPRALTGVVADMLWIDADHTYEAVLSDLRTFAPLVRPGGLICGHDYSVWHPDVVRAVDEHFADRRVQTLDIHRSIWWTTA